MNNNSGHTTTQFLVPLVLLLLATLALAYMMPKLTTVQTLAFGGGIVLFVVCLASTQAALYLLIFSMLLGPEFIVGTTQGASLGRGVTLRVDDFVLLIVAFSWLAKMAVNKDLGMFVKTPLNKPIGCYIIVCLICTLLGAMYGNVNLKTGFLFVLKYFEYVFVYFMVTFHLEDRKQIQNYLWAMLITCILVSIIGIAQIPGGERVSAPFEGQGGEPNTFGGYLVFMICIVTGLLLTTSSFGAKMLYGILIFLFVVPLAYTQSRSSYVALVPAVLSFVWLSEKRIWVLLAVISLGLALPFVAPKATKDRIAYTFTGEDRSDVGMMGVTVDTSTSARLKSWRGVAKNWIKHPIFGFGVTGYGFLDAEYFRVLIETGLAGLLAFLILLSTIFVQAYKVLKKASRSFDKGLCMGFLAGYIGLLFHAVGANTFIIVRIMEPFWFVLAMVIVMPHLEPESPEEHSGEAKEQIAQVGV